MYRGDFVQIEDSLRGIVYAMNETMSQVMTAANQVDIGSNHVSNGAQALAQGATEHTSAVEELSATIQEISDKINHTAQRADLAEKQTIAAKNSLDRSSKMRELVVAMHQIKDSSGQIEGIIKAIDDIAFQTNILALSAASREELSGQAAMLRDLLKGFKFADRRTEPEASRSFEGDPDEDAGEPAFAGADFNKY